MELTIPGAVASAAREFGDAPALAEGWPTPGWPTLGWPSLGLGRTASGSATASWTSGSPRSLPR